MRCSECRVHRDDCSQVLQSRNILRANKLLGSFKLDVATVWSQPGTCSHYCIILTYYHCLNTAAAQYSGRALETLTYRLVTMEIIVTTSPLCGIFYNNIQIEISVCSKIYLHFTILLVILVAIQVNTKEHLRCIACMYICTYVK